MLQLGSDKPKSAIAVYSGGLDSTVLLRAMVDAGIEVRGALTVDYGQKHRKEIEEPLEFAGKWGLSTESRT